MLSRLQCVFWCRGRRKSEWGRRYARGARQVRATKGETCVDQMTDSFQAHKDDAAIIESSACDAFRACEETALHCMCSVYGCTVNTEITTISQMM